MQYAVEVFLGVLVNGSATTKFWFSVFRSDKCSTTCVLGVCIIRIRDNNDSIRIASSDHI